MDQFVCVRLVQAWGMDLRLFQFDYNLTWAVFLMNADRTLYGRYSWRGSKDIEGLREALKGALELHARYPANKDELGGKTGPELPWKTAEDIPSIKAKGKFREAEGKSGCIHCHNVIEGLRKSYRSIGRELPGRLAASYPTPARAGLTLDPARRPTVSHVQKGSAADRAGLRPADRILRLGGQPLISIADLEWVLFVADDPASLVAEVERDGQRLELRLELPAGWRSKD